MPIDNNFNQMLLVFPNANTINTRDTNTNAPYITNDLIVLVGHSEYSQNYLYIYDY